MTLSTVPSRKLDESRLIVTESLSAIRKSAASIADTMQSEVLHNSKVLRTVATMLEEGLVLLDKDSRITIFNPAAASIFGVNASDAVGKTFDQLFPSLARRLQESNESVQDIQALDEQGRQGVVNVSFSRLTSPDEGTPFSVLIATKGSGRRASDQENFDTSHAIVDQMYQLALWNFPMPAFFTDVSGQAIRGSQEFYVLMGRTPNQMTGRGVEEILPEAYVQWYYQEVENTSMRMNLSTPQGVQEFVAHKSPIRAHDGGPVLGFITCLVRQTESAAVEMGFISTFIKTIDALPSPIMLVSFSEGRILLVNKAFGEKYHYDRQDTINSHVQNLLADPSTFAKMKRQMVVPLAKGDDSIQRFRIKDGLGNKVWLTIKAISISTDGTQSKLPKYCLLTEC